MITREQIHELAQFEDEAGCALSFYFQPAPPRNKAHREEAILTKDLAREALRQLESRSSQGKSKTRSKTNASRLAPIWTASSACRRNCAATARTRRPCLPAGRKSSGGSTICPRT